MRRLLLCKACKSANIEEISNRLSSFLPLATIRYPCYWFAAVSSFIICKQGKVSRYFVNEFMSARLSYKSRILASGSFSFKSSMRTFGTATVSHTLLDSYLACLTQFLTIRCVPKYECGRFSPGSAKAAKSKNTHEPPNSTA